MLTDDATLIMVSFVKHKTLMQTYITAVPCLVFDRFTHCTVDGLSPSHDYQFRVIAENFYGRSDPCEPTSLVQTVTEQEGRRKKGLGDTDGRSTLTC